MMTLQQVIIFGLCRPADQVDHKEGWLRLLFLKAPDDAPNIRMLVNPSPSNELIFPLGR